MKEKYDIFISYRRDGGFEMAKLLSEKLTRKGYKVFMDVEALKSGKFNDQLYSVIDTCKDVILVCSPGAMDRFSDPNDWVRKEISYAIDNGKNVIPVMLRGFIFPKADELPEEIKEIVCFNALMAEKELFDESVEKLCRDFLLSKPSKKRNKIIALFTVLAIVIAAVTILLCSGTFHYESSTAEKYDFEVKKSVDTLCTSVVGTVDISGSAVIKALDYCKKYIDGDVDEDTLNDHCELQEENIDNTYSKLSISESVMSNAEEFDFCKAALETMNKCAGFKQLIQFANIVTLMPNVSDTEKKNIISQLEEIVKYEYLIALDETYGAILPMLNDGYDCDYIMTYLHDSATYSELSECMSDSFFWIDDREITDEKINQKIDFFKDAITKCNGEISEAVGTMWKDYIIQ